MCSISLLSDFHWVPTKNQTSHNVLQMKRDEEDRIIKYGSTDITQYQAN